MSLDVTTLAQYNGGYEQEFYTKFLLGSEVLNEVFTLLPNVKNSQNLSIMEVDAGVIQDADCSFSPTGATLTEKKVTVQDKKINVEYCYKTLEQIYYSQFLQAGSNNTNSPEFNQAVLSEIAKRANAELVTNALGTGAESVVTEMAGDAEVVKETIASITSTNAIEQFGLVYEAFPAELEDAEGKFFLVDNATFRALKINAIDTTVPQSLWDEKTGVTFLGIPVYQSGALEANTIIMSRKENMIYATDLVSDMEQVEVIDRMPVSGEPNIRFVAHFKYDFTYVFGSEIVLGQTA